MPPSVLAMKSGQPESRSTKRLRYSSLAMPAPSSMSRRRTLRPFGPVWCVTKVLPSNSFANAGTSAPFFVSLTPPALPRPPAWIWAFTTYTGAFSFAAHFSAASDTEVAHAGLTVHVDLHAAVLVVERGIDQHRILRDVEPIALKLADHRREVLLQRAGPVREIQQRCVQPDADPPRDGADAAAFFAFADDRGGDYVARVQLVHEPLALGVDQMAALRPDALGDQRADQLLRVHRAGRVVLEGVDLQQLGPDPVRHRQRVPGRAVVVAGREALDVQAADATRRKDHRLGDHHDEALVIQILKHRARAGPLPIAQQLDGGAELQELG